MTRKKGQKTMLDKTLYSSENIIEVLWQPWNLTFEVSFKNKKIFTADVWDLDNGLKSRPLDEDGRYKNLPLEWWKVEKYYNRFLKHAKYAGYYI